MPELPEVETIKLQLNRALVGLVIAKTTVLSQKNFLGSPRDILGEKVAGVERRAKIILIKLGDDKCLAIHLKMTGQLIFQDKQSVIGNQREKEKNGRYGVSELPNKYTRVMVEFKTGEKLYFNDLRKFGWMKVVKNSRPKADHRLDEKIKNSCLDLPELSRLGPEAIDKKRFSLAYFQKILSKTKKPIKLVLLDQEKIAGVGNIYANEALFAAGILPTKPANKLKEEEISRLRQMMIKILNLAIAHQGTSDKDEAYRQISGEKGNFQNYLQVYGRQNQKCPHCSAKIRRIKLGGRGTFYCPKCQI